MLVILSNCYIERHHGFFSSKQPDPNPVDQVWANMPECVYQADISTMLMNCNSSWFISDAVSTRTLSVWLLTSHINSVTLDQNIISVTLDQSYQQCDSWPEHYQCDSWPVILTVWLLTRTLSVWLLTSHIRAWVRVKGINLKHTVWT